jgi:hypothetical protein
LVLYYFFNPCLSLKFAKPPEKISRIVSSSDTKIAFLYGDFCGECPSGNFLYSLKDKKNIIFVVPPNFILNDMENLKELFSLEGKIIKGNSETEHLLKKIATCLKVDSWKNNFIADVKNEKRISSVKTFY